MGYLNTYPLSVLRQRSLKSKQGPGVKEPASPRQETSSWSLTPQHKPHSLQGKHVPFEYFFPPLVFTLWSKALAASPASVHLEIVRKLGAYCYRNIALLLYIYIYIKVVFVHPSLVCMFLCVLIHNPPFVLKRGNIVN